MKITNQLIESCKDAIIGQEAADKIWDKDPGPLLELLEQTLRFGVEGEPLFAGFDEMRNFMSFLALKSGSTLHLRQPDS